MTGGQVSCRNCLLETSHEVRLYAYAELEKSSRVYEDEIADLSRKLSRRPKRVTTTSRPTLALAISAGSARGSPAAGTLTLSSWGRSS